MKKSIQLMTLAAFMFAAFTVSAQAVKPIKLGHIEVEKLMEIMPEVKKAETSLRAKQEEFQKVFEEMLTRRNELLKDLQDNGKNYTEVKRNTLEQDITDVNGRLQQLNTSAGEQMQAAESELFKPILEKIQKAIKQVGDENGFLYIFELGSNAIRYASETSEDVLPLVKKKLGLL
jgi:outer membrane protein